MKDSFDKYLKSEIEKSRIEISDNGFSELVIQNLPKKRAFFINRETIIIFSSVLSAIAFILFNGLNQFLSGLINLINGVINYSPINHEFFLVLIIFSIMILSIPFVEYRRRAF